MDVHACSYHYSLVIAKPYKIFMTNHSLYQMIDTWRDLHTVAAGCLSGATGTITASCIWSIQPRLEVTPSFAITSRTDR